MFPGIQGTTLFRRHVSEFRIGQQRFGKPNPMELAFRGSHTASERTALLFHMLGGAEQRLVHV